MKSQLYEIIKQPVVTEKTTKISENNQFVFKVENKSSKQDIKIAIEKIFKVKVKSINTIKIKGKTKVFKGKVGKRSDFKKAIVSLVKGQSIDLSLGV